jgi:hypothetical protein
MDYDFDLDLNELNRLAQAAYAEPVGASWDAFKNAASPHVVLTVLALLKKYTHDLEVQRCVISGTPTGGGLVGRLFNTEKALLLVHAELLDARKELAQAQAALATVQAELVDEAAYSKLAQEGNAALTEQLLRCSTVRVWPDAPDVPTLTVIRPLHNNKELATFVGKLWPDGRICFAGRKPPSSIGNGWRWMSLETL